MAPATFHPVGYRAHNNGVHSCSPELLGLRAATKRGKARADEGALSVDHQAQWANACSCSAGAGLRETASGLVGG